MPTDHGGWSSTAAATVGTSQPRSHSWSHCWSHCRLTFDAFGLSLFFFRLCLVQAVRGRNIASQHFRGRVGEAANRNTSAQAPRGPREGRHEHDCHALRGWPSRHYLSDERDLPHGILSSSCSSCNPCPHGKLKGNGSSCSPCPHGKRKALCGSCTLLNALLMQLVRLVSQAQLPWLQVLCRRGKLC